MIAVAIASLVLALVAYRQRFRARAAFHSEQITGKLQPVYQTEVRHVGVLWTPDLERHMQQVASDGSKAFWIDQILAAVVFGGGCVATALVVRSLRSGPG